MSRRKTNKRPQDGSLEKIFADRLEMAMLDFGVGVEELEYDDICCASSTREYLAGHRLPNLRTIWRIADYLGVTVDWLCGMDHDSTDDDILEEEIANELSMAYDKKREEFFKNFDSEAPWGTLQ